jgi:hypothetical protein
METVMQRSPEPPRSAPASQAAAAPATTAQSSNVQLRRALQGKGYDEQVQLLAPVQRAEDPGAVHAAAERGVASGGSSLPYLSDIQAAFGRHDVSDVQAHSDSAAQSASAAIGAEAYASGSDIAFAGNPDKSTVAHEAAHVVQQRAGVSLSGGVGQAGDPYERHADAVADAVVQGKSAEPILDQMAGGGARETVQKKSAAVQRTLVSKQITDGPYGWTSAYDVLFDDATHECRISVRVKLTPENATVTAADVTRIQGVAQTQFQAIWDNKFKITDSGTGVQYRLRLALAFVDANEHVAVTLHPGAGRDDRRNWYVQQIDNVTLAHELGHQLGLKDEYVDPAVPARADASGAGVHQDHSIMGDYYAEGEGAAAAQDRHGAEIAGNVAAATGRTLTSGR